MRGQIRNPLHRFCIIIVVGRIADNDFGARLARLVTRQEGSEQPDPLTLGKLTGGIHQGSRLDRQDYLESIYLGNRRDGLKPLSETYTKLNIAD